MQRLKIQYITRARIGFIRCGGYVRCSIIDARTFVSSYEFCHLFLPAPRDKSDAQLAGSLRERIILPFPLPVLLRIIVAIAWTLIFIVCLGLVIRIFLFMIMTSFENTWHTRIRRMPQETAKAGQGWQDQLPREPIAIPQSKLMLSLTSPG